MVIVGGAARLARRLLDAVRHDCSGLMTAVRASLPVRPGLYAYEVRPNGGSRRIHLRIEPDGYAVMLVDVTDAIHLNPAAALVARLALERATVREALVALRSRFRGTDPVRLGQQVSQIYALVGHLATTTDPCPTCGLTGLTRIPLFSAPVRAPYKADLALTYGCNNSCGHCYNEPRRRQMPSLKLDDWRRVLRRLSAIGVPHVIFTGGEPTFLGGLEELVRFAGRLGLVTGLNTNGRRLAERGMARNFARAGLDHVQITLLSHRPEVHNAMTGADCFDQTVRGIESSLAAGLHTITNTTLTRRNADHAEQVVQLLASLGLSTFALNGMIYSGKGSASPDALGEEELAVVLHGVRERAAELGMRMLWYTPTAYCRLSPVELELAPRRCNAGEYSICIEPNGDVLPCQSYYRVAGNLLRDPWDRIWNGALFRSFRDRVADPRRCGLPEPCWDCPDLPLCAGGCRIQREEGMLDLGWADARSLRASHPR